MRIARAFIALAALALSALGPAPAAAQDWPTRTIKIIVGFSAGGGTDLAARIVAQPLQEILGQPVVVENRPSAGGIIGDDEQCACRLGGDVQGAALRSREGFPDAVAGRDRGPGDDHRAGISRQ
jgi:tripartite-type tricarboxylate transporter receptor subunit TctC